MEQISACEICGTPITPRMIAGKPVRNCSRECAVINYRQKKHEKYAQEREERIEKTRQWRLANPERTKEQGRRYREVNKEAIQQRKAQYHVANREKINRRSTAWYQANRERVRAEWAASQTGEDRARAAERTRQWATANPERRAELRRQWAKANPEKVTAVAQRRRARKRGVPAELVTVVELMIDQDFQCYLCGESMDPECKAPHPLCPTIDHIIPIARGGTGLRENLAAAHMRCNSIKGARLHRSA